MNARASQFPPSAAAHSRAGFTMVEVALCLAIIAFAMVAIIGVMPSGLNVQKQNREDTIIDQDAQLLLEAIRGGAMRLDDLTNYVDFITVEHHEFLPDRGRPANGFEGVHYGGEVPVPNSRGVLQNPEDIVALLSLPKYDFYRGVAVTNFVTAQFRAFSGAFNEKILPRGSTNSPAQTEFAFRYQVTAEIVPVFTGPAEGESGSITQQRQRLSQSLHDLRLTFQWPVFQSGNTFTVGNNRKTYRVQVSGQHTPYRPPNWTADILGSQITRRRFTTSTLAYQ